MSNEEIEVILNILDYKESDIPTIKKQEVAFLILLAIETAMR